MKNMMLPAKSCSIILCSLLLLAAGCKPKKEPVNPDNQNLSGNVARPTWTAPADYDMTSSMTAVIKVATLNGQIVNDSIVNDDDLLAAFSGETCLGVAVPDDGLFFLYIAGLSSDSDSGLSSVSEAVTLRYYSAHYKNLFEAKDAFPYVSDSNQGSADTPFLPAFVVIK